MSEHRTPSLRGRRHKERVKTEKDQIREILDRNYLGHLSVVDQATEFPFTIPIAYSLGDDALYLHGAAANHALSTAVGRPCSFVVTEVSEFVLADTMFSHSINYASVILYGIGKEITDLELKDFLLVNLVDRLYPGRSKTLPPNTRSELLQTKVISLELHNASAKVRNDPLDLAIKDGRWVGTVPIQTLFNVADTELRPKLGRSITKKTEAVS